MTADASSGSLGRLDANLNRNGHPTFHRGRRLLAIALLGLTLLGSSGVAAAAAQVPMYTYEIVHTYPHDTHAFTEGLFYLDGVLYESTGLKGQSEIRRVKLDTGQVLALVKIPAQYFGEGLVQWKDRLISLTWQSGLGFVYDLKSLKKLREFHYPGEGWALTQDGHRLIMSDGTSQLRFLDPETLQEKSRVTVTYQGEPVTRLNELEYVNGEVYANLWQTNLIVRINPLTGQVVGVVNLKGLLGPNDTVAGQTDVLNGIAYDAQADRLFVTGKNWPKLFEIRLHRVSDSGLFH